MKYTFNQFKRLLFESILDEDKSRLIDKLVLPDIENEEERQKARDEMKAFFRKYSNFENKLDWNKLSSITYVDFEKIKELATQTKGAQKREILRGDIKSIFKSVGNRKFEIVGENEDWLFVAPFTWEAAVYCDSSENQGAGAKWCIGYGKSSESWDMYYDNGSLFIMAFNKNYKLLSQDELQTKLKYMIEKDGDDNINVWNQADINHDFHNGEFDISKSELNKMFKTVFEIKSKIYQQKIQNKLETLKNTKVIDEEFFTETEKQFIKEIVIPDNITHIKTGAFSDFKNLKTVFIPNSVIDIEYGAFARCRSLTSFSVDSDNSTYKSVDGFLLTKDGKTLVSGINNIAIIPDGVTTIGEWAFEGYENLKNVTFSNSVKNIEQGAFQTCMGLKNVTIGSGIISIGEKAFCYCQNLKSVIIPDGVKSIRNGAFYECISLKNIFIPNSVTSIGNFVFNGCNNLREIIIPNSVNEIGYGAFYETSLTKVIFKGKTLSQIRSMRNYPWDIKHPEKVINVEK